MGFLKDLVNSASQSVHIKNKKCRLSFFSVFLSFSLIFILFSIYFCIFVFIELRVRVSHVTQEEKYRRY